MSKRRLWVAVWCVLLVLSIGSTSGLASGKLTVYVNYEREDCELLISEFMKDRPDISAEFFRAPIEELMTILETEVNANVCRADVVVLGDPARMMQFRDMGVFEPYEIPQSELDMIVPSFIDEDGILLPISIVPYLIQYNSELIAEEDVPTSWADLLDEKWARKLIIADPRLTGGIHTPMWFITKCLEREYGEPYGWDYYKELVKLDPMVVGGHRKIRDMVVTGERPVSASQAVDMVISAVNEGEPAWFVWPEEGAPSIYEVAAVVKDSQNPESAQEFIRWMSSKRAGEVILKSGRIPVRVDVDFKAPDGKGLADLPLVPVDYSEFTAELKAEQTEKFYEIYEEHRPR